MSEQKIPSPEVVKKYILEECTEPIVFREFINDWSILSWTLDTWTEKLGNRSLLFRSGVRKFTKYPQWEAHCEKINLTLKELIDQERNDENKETDEHSRWMYFDYKYMNEWFTEHKEIFNAVTWKNFGFPDRGAAESTIWIGNNGAHTPCHMDTYGSNLVAQVYGRKQWILFPPYKSSSLRATRIPYEESSIYSNINLYSPDPIVAHDLEEAYVVTLSPGDVLFVPSHWWHYVENIDIAISINTWIPLPSDDTNRLQEALVKFFISQVCKDLPEQEQVNLLNPNEMDLVEQPLSLILEQIDICKNKCLHNLEDQPKKKKRKIEGDTSENLCCKKDRRNDFFVSFKKCIEPVPKMTLKEFKELLEEKHKYFTTKNIQPVIIDEPENRVQNLINAFCHPDIILKIQEKLLFQN